MEQHPTASHPSLWFGVIPLLRLSLPANSAASNGGIVVAEQASVLTLDSSTFDGNQAPKVCLAEVGTKG